MKVSTKFFIYSILLVSIGLHSTNSLATPSSCEIHFGEQQLVNFLPPDRASTHELSSAQFWKYFVESPPQDPASYLNAIIESRGGGFITEHLTNTGRIIKGKQVEHFPVAPIKSIFQIFSDSYPNDIEFLDAIDSILRLFVDSSNSIFREYALEALAIRPKAFKIWLKRQEDKVQLGPFVLENFIKSFDHWNFVEIVDILKRKKITITIRSNISPNLVHGHQPKMFSEGDFDNFTQLQKIINQTRFSPHQKAVNFLMLSSLFTRVRQQTMAFDILMGIAENSKFEPLSLLETLKSLSSWSLFNGIDRVLLYSHIKNKISIPKGLFRGRTSGSTRDFFDSRFSLKSDKVLSLVQSIDWNLQSLDRGKYFDTLRQQRRQNLEDEQVDLSQILEGLDDAQLNLLAFYYEMIEINVAGTYLNPELNDFDLSIVSENQGLKHILSELIRARDTDFEPIFILKTRRIVFTRPYKLNRVALDKHEDIFADISARAQKLLIVSTAKKLEYEWRELSNFATDHDSLEYLIRIQRLYEKMLFILSTDGNNDTDDNEISRAADILLNLLTTINESEPETTILSTEIMDSTTQLTIAQLKLALVKKLESML